MREIALNKLIASTINAGLVAQGVTVAVEQDEQPTTQGTPTADTVLFHNLGDTRYGFPKETDTFDATSGVMTHTSTVWYLTQFQVAAQVIQNPANQSQVTAGDYLQIVSAIMQSPITIEALNAVGVGIMRIRGIKPTYFKNDRGQFDKSPIFEFTVCHKDILTQIVPSTKTIVSNVVNV